MYNMSLSIWRIGRRIRSIISSGIDYVRNLVWCWSSISFVCQCDNAISFKSLHPQAFANFSSILYVIFLNIFRALSLFVCFGAVNLFFFSRPRNNNLNTEQTKWKHLRRMHVSPINYVGQTMLTILIETEERWPKKIQFLYHSQNICLTTFIVALVCYNMYI